MPGVVANVPNACPKYVPISTEILARCATEVVAHFRQALCLAIGIDEEDDFRLLYAERDLCEGDENSENAFKKQLESGKPCFVRVLFRLLGGKGGFGALLRKQANKGKKTKNFDAMRDLTGRRIRHSNAVDRIKEWMVAQNKEDELVNLIAGEGPELPKPVPASESLDPEFVRKLKRASKDRVAVVAEGMRTVDAEEEDLGKRARTGGAGIATASSSSSGADFLGALDTLADLSGSSEEASPDGEDTAEQSTSAAAAEPTKSVAAAPVEAAKTDVADVTAEATKAAATSSAIAEMIAESFCIGSEQLDVEQASNRTPRGRARAGDDAEDKEEAAPVACIGAADLKRYKTAADLAAKVPAETLKQSLQKLGLKCGGTPEDRAARFFQLKTIKLEDVPKKDFAKK